MIEFVDADIQEDYDMLKMEEEDLIGDLYHVQRKIEQLEEENEWQ